MGKCKHKNPEFTKVDIQAKELEKLENSRINMGNQRKSKRAGKGVAFCLKKLSKYVSLAFDV